MTKFTPLSLLLLTFGLLQSCSMMLPKYHKIPSLDVMYIHKKPMAGDYAVYEVDNGRLQKRYEVEKVFNNEITIRYRVIYPGIDSQPWAVKKVQAAASSLWYYRKLNREGRVLEAWLIDGEQRFNTPIAKSGEIHSLEHLTHLSNPVEKPIKTRGGTFKVDDAYNFLYRLDVGLVGSKSTHFDMLSDHVPFRLIRGEIIATDEESPFLKTLEFMADFGEAVIKDDYFSLYDKLNPSINVQHITNDLIEYGNSNK